MNAAQAREMVKVSIETKRPLVEALHYRYHPAFIRALQIIDNGVIGDVTHMSAYFSAPVPFRDGEVRHTLSIGGGSLMDMGCYPVHWSRMIMKSEPKIIKATSLLSQPNIDLTTTAELDFGEGRIAKIECSMDVERPLHAEFDVLGSKGQLHFDNPLSPHNGHEIRITTKAGTVSEVVDGSKTYDYQLTHMMNVLLHGEKPIGGGQDSILNMVAIDAIYTKAGLRPR